MKLLRHLFMLFLVASKVSLAQNDSSIFKPSRKIELMVLPTLIYNSVHLGYSWKTKKKTENVVLVSPVVIAFGIFSCKVQYNKNFTISKFKEESFYIPVWTSIRRVNSWGEESYTSSMHIAFGTGFGTKQKIKKKEKWRIEVGIGASLNLLSNPELVPLYQVTDFDFPASGIIMPAARFNIRYLIGL